MVTLKSARRVVVVDDSRTIQAMMDNLFSSRRDFQVVGFAAEANTAAELVRTLLPDIVTIDLCMPYLDGEALLAMIKDLTGTCKVVVSEKCASNRLLYTRLMEAGASLCMTKSELAADPATAFRLIGKAADRTGTKGRDVSDRTSPVFRSPAPAAGNQIPGELPFPVPADEEDRLRVARSKALFNATREPQFDAITRNAARLTGFPIALLTFIDRDIQWIKSSHGLNVEQAPREQAFCAYTISQGGAFAVSNAATHDRFAQYPMVVGEPGIRSYAGFPIRTHGGVTIGTLCVIDTRVRTISRYTLDQLAGLSDIIAELIESRPDIAA